MEKLREFGNYLVSVYDQSNQDALLNINGTLINLPEFLIPQVIKSFREEKEEENQSVIELDENKNEIIVKKHSQLNELASVYGLDYSNIEVKNKVLEYLNQLLVYKSQL
jgi:hypothetical protein